TVAARARRVIARDVATRELFAVAALARRVARAARRLDVRRVAHRLEPLVEHLARARRVLLPRRRGVMADAADLRRPREELGLMAARLRARHVIALVAGRRERPVGCARVTRDAVIDVDLPLLVLGVIEAEILAQLRWLLVALVAGRAFRARRRKRLLAVVAPGLAVE